MIEKDVSFKDETKQRPKSLKETIDQIVPIT